MQSVNRKAVFASNHTLQLTKDSWMSCGNEVLPERYKISFALCLAVPGLEI